MTKEQILKKERDYKNKLKEMTFPKLVKYFRILELGVAEIGYEEENWQIDMVEKEILDRYSQACNKVL